MFDRVVGSRRVTPRPPQSQVNAKATPVRRLACSHRCSGASPGTRRRCRLAAVPFGGVPFGGVPFGGVPFGGVRGGSPVANAARHGDGGLRRFADRQRGFVEVRDAGPLPTQRTNLFGVGERLFLQLVDS